MLEMKAVTYAYQGEQFQFDLQLGLGEIVALMGASGAGKSTLLSLIAGFIMPNSGDIIYQQTSLLTSAAHQRPVAMLFQEHNLFAHLTVRQNIGLGFHPNLRLNFEQKQQLLEIAQRVGLAQLLDRLPEQLSGGQRQRVALARCFAQARPIWLLDEPFSALDPVLREDMLNLVKQWAAECKSTVLMVTHHISDARAIADRFAFIGQGKIQAQGQIARLTADHIDPQVAHFVALAER